MQQLIEKETSSFVRTMKRAAGVSSLPDDIIIVILSMLPAKSISRFRCVCKLWLERFKNPDFIKKHLINYSVEKKNFSVFIGGSCKESSYYCVDFDAASASYLSNKAVKIDFPSALHSKLHNRRKWVGSCNGILCFSCLNWADDTVTYFLWNPYSQEYKEIKEYRKTVKQSYDDEYISAYGFCYDCKVYDYKLILIYDHDTDLSEIKVYRLGSNSWKTVGNTFSVYNGQRFSCVLDGSVHWLARKVIVTANKQAASMVIVCFDIAEETTKEIQVPSCFSELHKNCRYSSNSMVGVLGKQLYLSDSVSDVFELWVMKDYGVVDSWTKVLRFSQQMENIRICKTLSYCNKNREILFSCSNLQDNCDNALVSYDLRSENFTLLKLNGMPKRFNAESFIGSLVSINPRSKRLKSSSSKKEKNKRINLIMTRSRTQATMEEAAINGHT